MKMFSCPIYAAGRGARIIIKRLCVHMTFLEEKKKKVYLELLGRTAEEHTQQGPAAAAATAAACCSFSAVLYSASMWHLAHAAKRVCATVNFPRLDKLLHVLRSTIKLQRERLCRDMCMEMCM